VKAFRVKVNPGRSEEGAQASGRILICPVRRKGRSKGEQFGRNHSSCQTALEGGKKGGA